MTNQSEVLSIIKMIRPKKSTFRKVRIGSLSDGGYVLPDDLDGIDSLLSLGVGDEVSFDLHFLKKGIPVYQYDPTIDSSPSDNADSFIFHKIAWASHDSIGGRSLSSMVQQHEIFNSDRGILKFDTEGAEWECIPTTSEHTLKHFRIIVCELHGLNSLGNGELRRKIRETLGLLTRNHTVMHLHANNCCGITLVEGVPVPAVVELTLLRNDRSEFTTCNEAIPGPLDYPNMNDRADLVLNYYD
jgi:hypothetical protein